MGVREKNREKIMKSIFISLLLSIAVANDDIEVNMTPGGLPAPPTKRIKKSEIYDDLLPEGEWEMLLNAMVWTEGPAWWNEKLAFSDTRLGKIWSWDPKTKLVGVVLERSGADFSIQEFGWSLVQTGWLTIN